VRRLKTSLIFCFRKYICSKHKQSCFGYYWIEHCLHYAYLSRQWRHSRRRCRNTGWRRHTSKINLSKSDISTERRTIRVPDSRKLMANVVISWTRQTDGVFFIDPQKTIVDQNCYIDLLKTSLLSECRRLYPGNDFKLLQDSVLSHRVKVSMTEHSRLHSCWRMDIIFSRS